MARLARVLGTPERRNRPTSGKGGRLELSLAGRNDDTDISLASQPLRIILTHLGVGPVDMEAVHA